MHGCTYIYAQCMVFKFHKLIYILCIIANIRLFQLIDSFLYNSVLQSLNTGWSKQENTKIINKIIDNRNKVYETIKNILNTYSEG